MPVPFTVELKVTAWHQFPLCLKPHIGWSLDHKTFYKYPLRSNMKKDNDFINWFLLDGKLVGKNSLGNLKCNAVTFVHFKIFGLNYLYFRHSLFETYNMIDGVLHSRPTWCCYSSTHLATKLRRKQETCGRSRTEINL